jgi:hypothetical protein
LPDNRIDVRIMNALEQALFHSVRSLCSAIKYPCTSVWRHLHSTGHVIRNLHLVPQSPSSAQKVRTVRTMIEFEKLLGSAIQRTWQYALKDDESRFDFTIEYDERLVPEGTEIPTWSRRTFGSRKGC